MLQLLGDVHAQPTVVSLVVDPARHQVLVVLQLLNRDVAPGQTQSESCVEKRDGKIDYFSCSTILSV